MSSIEEIQSQDSKAATHKYPFLSDLNLDQDVTRRLALHLDGIVRGNSDVFTTPICKRIDPKTILSRFDVVFDANKTRMNEELLQLEMSSRDKFGPRSIAKPWSERIDDVKSYYQNSDANIPNVSSGYPSKTANLRPLSADKAVKLLKNNTNSGLPFYTAKSKVKPRLIRDFDYLKYRKDPCILFTRTQENNKTRTVWGYPIIDSLIEMTFYAVLLPYQRKLSWRAAVRSPDDVDVEITKLIDRAINNSLNIISIDFSQYDSSLSVKLIQYAFGYIKRLFQSIYHDTLDLICDRFCSIGLLTPNGILKGKHGVPSGSTFTNEVDSICQFLVALSSGFVNSGDCQIQGDDGVYVVEPLFTEDFIDHFGLFNLKVNKDKSYVRKNSCVYLQKYYHPDYRKRNGIIGGIYPLYRALCRIVYQERWSDFEDYGIEGSDYYSLRTISILENCKHHPLFEEFVKFIYDLDKYSLSYSNEGLNRYVNNLFDDKSSFETLYNQYGNDVRGLKRFDTVRIIKSLS